MKDLLKFMPIYKERIWGGDKIIKKFNRESDISNCGESWEISAIEGDLSIINSENFKGISIKEILHKYNKEILGKIDYGQFPLLVKFLDARYDLSIQVHPDDIKAKEYDSFGKTEMWHILDAEKDSYIYIGFKDGVNESIVKQKIKEGNILDIINKIPVKKGDTFFIPSGLVHGIGKGIMLLEIQQTSDITFRFYDFDRVDKNGKKRELHISQALKCIDFSIKEDTYKIEKNLGELVSCKYFTIEKIILEKNENIDYENFDSFFILVCTEGEVILNENTSLKKGETVLIPKSLGRLEVVSRDKSEFFKIRV